MIEFETKPFDTGTFTTAFKSTCGKYVKLHSTCPIKRALAEFNKLGTAKEVLPDITEIEPNVYVMPYYVTCEKLKGVSVKLTPEHRILLGELTELEPHLASPFDATSHWLKEFGKLSCDKVKKELYKLIHIIGEEDTAFEITHRNLAVDLEKGKLVLMDCFFSTLQNRKVRYAKFAKAHSKA